MAHRWPPVRGDSLSSIPPPRQPTARDRTKHCTKLHTRSLQPRDPCHSTSLGIGPSTAARADAQTAPDNASGKACTKLTLKRLRVVSPPRVPAACREPQRGSIGTASYPRGGLVDLYSGGRPASRCGSSGGTASRRTPLPYIVTNGPVPAELFGRGAFWSRPVGESPQHAGPLRLIGSDRGPVRYLR